MSITKARVYSECVIVIEPIAHVLASMSPDVMIEIIAIENKLNINVFNLLEVVHACESGAGLRHACARVGALNVESLQMTSSLIVLELP